MVSEIGGPKQDVPREFLQWFAGRMEKKLKANDHKRSWEGLSPEYFLRRARQELAELEEAISNGKSPDEIIDECADLANFAGMCADNQRILMDQVEPTIRGRRI